MTEVQIKPRSRAPQVVKALYNYGPLNVNALSEILEPPMKARRTQDCLQRLVKRGLIIRCNKIDNHFSKNYFQLSTSGIVKHEISKIINIDPNKLNIPNFRAHDIEHSVSCGFWANYFNRHYPDADIIRDFHLGTNENILNRLMVGKDIEFYPDITVTYKSNAINDYVTIAVEVEKTPKARSRIFKKLNKFSTRSLVDGVIYICPTHSIIDLVNGVYSSRLKSEARRIRQYGDFFLMFTNSYTPDANECTKMISSSGDAISLKKWMSVLENNLWQKRRNQMFKVQRKGAELQ